MNPYNYWIVFFVGVVIGAGGMWFLVAFYWAEALLKRLDKDIELEEISEQYKRDIREINKE